MFLQFLLLHPHATQKTPFTRQEQLGEKKEEEGVRKDDPSLKMPGPYSVELQQGSPLTAL